jgi:hypothetical protein
MVVMAAMRTMMKKVSQAAGNCSTSFIIIKKAGQYPAFFIGLMIRAGHV